MDPTDPTDQCIKQCAIKYPKEDNYMCEGECIEQCRKHCETKYPMEPEQWQKNLTPQRSCRSKCDEHSTYKATTDRGVCPKIRLFNCGMVPSPYDNCGDYYVRDSDNTYKACILDSGSNPKCVTSAIECQPHIGR